MTDLVSIGHIVRIGVGVLLGVVGVLTLRQRIGWSRMGALMAVWAVAADTSVPTLNAILMWTLGLRPPDYHWSVWPRGWHYIPLTIQAMVALALVVIHIKERKTP